MKKLNANSKGFLLIEIVLAVTLFGLIALIILSSFIYGRSSTDTAGNSFRASEIANEAVEALSNISQSSYTTISGYTHGTNYYLVNTSSQWNLTTTSTTIDTIYTVDIIFSNGPTTTSTQAKIKVTWPEASHNTGSISATTYLSDWQIATVAPPSAGILVYANGGTNSQLIDYRLLLNSGAWTNPAPLPAISPANAVAREVKIYASQTGNNKAVLCRFFDGTNQYIVGYIWNGSSWSGGQQLAEWQSSTDLDIGNYSGAFMNNGTFVAVYADGTNSPKYNTWNGLSWSAQAPLPAISASNSGVPTSITIAARPGFNEVMTAMLTNEYKTITTLYANNTWSAAITQANSGVNNASKEVHFAWSPVNPADGALVFTSQSDQRSIDIRVFTDTGGTGTWGPIISTNDQPVGSKSFTVDIAAQPSGTEEWEACDKDNSTPQSTYCYTVTPSGITNPANQAINTSANIGVQQSEELGFELASGVTAISAYSNSTVNAQVKTFSSTSNSWATSSTSLPAAAAVIYKTHVIPEPKQNDIMILVSDSNNNLYSVMFDGATGNIYNSPAGYAWTIHNANGPSTAAKWYDFAWNN